MYLERDASGQRLVALRLIGDQDEERFVIPEDTEPADAPRLGAEWLRSRIDASDASGIGLICLDPRGSVCSWLDVPGDDPSVVRAAVRQKSSGAWGDWPGMPGVETNDTVESLVPIGAGSLEPLGLSDKGGAKSQGLVLKSRVPAESAGASRRSAVLAVGDLPVRLLIDALDAMGIEARQVTTLWHAIASAWDPASESREAHDPLVTTPRVDTAVLLIEPEGRAQWAWCDEGRLLAAGSAMLEEGALTSDESARRFASGRLAMDWLAWSAQLGRSPRRVFCLVDDDARSAPSAGAFGEAVAGVWPGASVDLVRVGDPVLSTMVRLRERTAGGKTRRAIEESQQIGSLASRAGRAHRAMYRWAALAIVIGGVALAILGFKLRELAADARESAADVTTETNALILSELGDKADPIYPILSLQSAINQVRGDQDAGDFSEAKPVLLALDEIAERSLYADDVTFTRITLDYAFLSINIESQDAEKAEEAPDAFDDTIYSNWRRSDITQRDGKTIVALMGDWRDPEPGEARP